MSDSDDAETPKHEDSEGAEGSESRQETERAGERPENAVSAGGREPVRAADTIGTPHGEVSATSADREGNEQREVAAPEPSGPAADRRKTPRGPRPSLSEEREPVFHDAEGYRLRLEPPDLARLRELPGAKGKTDRELGEQFFNGQSPRLIASIAGDVETPAEVRVIVDPYSRQAFLAVGKTIRGIVSF